ncbi:MAG: serine/threonine-protein phosphatase, partial [Spirochaetales bacterium]
FALRPQARGYFFFGMSALLLALYQGARTLFITTIIMDSAALVRIEYAALFLMVPFFLGFLETVLDGKVSLAVKFSAAVYLALGIASQVLRREPFLYAWYLVSAVAVIYYIVFLLFRASVRDFKGLKADGGGVRFFSTIKNFLLTTDSGKMLFGTLLIGVVVVLDSILADSGGKLNLTRYAYFIFLMGAASVLAGQFTATYKRMEDMTDGLERTVIARTSALARAAEDRTRLNAEIAEANRGLRNTMDQAKRDMAIAVSVQRGFFPSKPHVTRDWDVAFAFEPAVGVSGDFYDFYERDGELRGVVVGDVSGHGIASGLITLLARNVFFRRTFERQQEQLGVVLADVNRELVRELSSVDNFLTCAFLRLNGNKVEYVNAAHTDTLFRKGGMTDAMVLRPRDGQDFKAPPLGREGLDISVKALSFSVSDGDAILVYTDCLTEGRNTKGQEYGEDRLLEAFARADTENAESILASIMIDYRNFTAGVRRTDDLTAVVLRKI